MKAVLKLATDMTVNGKIVYLLCFAILTRLLGRSLGVVPRNIASEGYIDLDRDDQKEGDFVTKLERVSTEAVELRRAKYGK